VLRIQRGSHPLARLLATLLRLPRAAEAAPTHLTVTACGNGQRWRRTFNRRRLETVQYALHTGGLAERYGALEIRFDLRPSAGGIRYVQRQAAVHLGSRRLHLPPALSPRVEAREEPALSGVSVSVCVSLPAIGLLVAYDGLIEIEEARA
jgi:hypothetical protein